MRQADEEIATMPQNNKQLLIGTLVAGAVLSVISIGFVLILCWRKGNGAVVVSMNDSDNEIGNEMEVAALNA